MWHWAVSPGTASESIEASAAAVRPIFSNEWLDSTYRLPPVPLCTYSRNGQLKAAHRAHVAAWAGIALGYKIHMSILMEIWTPRPHLTRDYLSPHTSLHKP